ncbi:sulfurtransferase complex subunit TusC [Rheinheimera sp.]|jgi:tRNA 2-thiouridine synthesizing protein C|uniref:sulfurtransferase complex subunit TusC n=1 Tax=Rheinheimera sp. TaxID=1869214 RepID=UPI002638C982|nr:sulfurtransferase complex subunit TusC [Rheinheimera sp.]MCA1930818.1 sulfurtransferase complex subunit TusC [Rheinheimera sp.]
MKIAVIVTKLPLEGIAAKESLDLIFALSAVDHQVSVVFSDDAVYQLVQSTDSSELMVKDFRRSFKLFELYEIENLYICAESLRQRQLQANVLVLDVQPLESAELSQLFSTQQHVIKA